MLTELTVENLAIVERARLEPAPGLTALSGETGAGKSLLVGALTLLTGGRAELDAIRTGESRARLEARFQAGAERALALLESWGIPCDDGEIVIRREVAREGKSRAWVNQTSVTVAALARAGSDAARGPRPARAPAPAPCRPPARRARPLGRPG